MILEVSRGKMIRIVDVQALSVRFHRVARQTERSRLGVIHLIGNAHSGGQQRQQNSTANAKILPPRVAVILGRTTSRATSAALNTVSATIKAVAWGIDKISVIPARASAPAHNRN
jgi:hypothetical protein